jgi:hypothetical protein
MLTILLSRMMFRCLASVAVGIFVVMSFSGLLSLYGEAAEQPIEVSTNAMSFPENEKMLKALSVQLAREGARLAGIMPAAGNISAKRPAK